MPVGTTVTEISPNAADREFSESLPDDLIDFEFIPYDKAASEENKKPGITNNDENLFAKKAEQRKKEDRVRDERAKISDDTPGIEVASVFSFFSRFFDFFNLKFNLFLIFLGTLFISDMN